MTENWPEPAPILDPILCESTPIVMGPTAELLPGTLAGSGLPYPTTQDPLRNTDVYIRNLWDAIDYRLKNAAVALWVGHLVTNASGDAAINFTSLASVLGGVAMNIQDTNGAPGGTWAISPFILSKSGTILTIRWGYVPTDSGVTARAYDNRGLDAAVIAWGVAK